jgi:hypothetical protein
MPLSRKKFIKLLGAGTGALATPASLLANDHSTFESNATALQALQQNRKSRISYRYFLPWAPKWGDEKFANQRLEELIAFGHTAGIDSFQFYVNTPWSSYYLLPVDVESQQEWISWMKNVVAPRIRKEGFGLELNFQEILGANTFNTDVRSIYKWKQFMIDHKGNVSPGSPCPEDPIYRQEMAKMLQAWATLKPDIFLIDDDFRLHNHSTSGMFCYCPLHLNKFAALTGKTYTRESLLEEVLKPGEPSATRNTWLNFLGSSMTELADWVSKTVRSVAPETRVALMTSGTDIHSLEGRDWSDLLHHLSPNHKPLIRPTFGLYTGTSSAPKAAASGLLDILSQVQVIEQSLGKDNCEFAPELENTRYTTWSKSVAHSTCSLIMGQLAGLPFITVAVNDLDGSPLSEEPTLVPLFRNARPRMEAIAALSLKDWPVQGLIALSDKDSARMTHLKPGTDYRAMAPASRFEDPIFHMGIPFLYATAKDAAASSHPVLLEEASVWKASDDELKTILSGAVLMTSGAARLIADRGFGNLTGVSVKEHHNNGIQSEIYGDNQLPGVTAIRVPHRGADWDKLTLHEGAKTASCFLDFMGEQHPGTVLYSNTLGGRIAVYAQNSDMQGGLFGSHARLRWLHGVLSWISKGTYQALPVIPQHGVSLLKKNNEQYLYSFCNLGADVLSKFSLRWKGKPTSLRMLQQDGSWKTIPFTITDDAKGLPPKLVFDCRLNVYEWLIVQIS